MSKILKILQEQLFHLYNTDDIVYGSYEQARLAVRHLIQAINAELPKDKKLNIVPLSGELGGYMDYSESKAGQLLQSLDEGAKEDLLADMYMELADLYKKGEFKKGSEEEKMFKELELQFKKLMKSK